METRILSTVCLAVCIFLMSGFVTKAQEPFYDTKWEDGKMVSKTKYEIGNFGMYEPKSVIKYAYDEKGEFVKKEVCVWNPKYYYNNKTGRWEPDYGENNRTPKYCILQKKDMVNNFIYVELLLWNKKEKAYNPPAETMVFQLKDAEHFNYLAFQKGNVYDEMVNIINYHRGLLARLTE